MNPEHNTIEKTLLKVEAPQLKTNVSKLQQIFIKFEILVDFKDKKRQKTGSLLWSMKNLEYEQFFEIF